MCKDIDYWAAPQAAAVLGMRVRCGWKKGGTGMRQAFLCGRRAEGAGKVIGDIEGGVRGGDTGGQAT